MRFKQWLSEMPMQNFQRIGDWEPEQNPTLAYQQRRAPRKGYYGDDFGILTSDSAVEKIKRKWSKCEEPFNVFALRSAVGSKIREEGVVDTQFLANNLKLSPEVIQQIAQPNTINIVFTNNIGGERMPMNWWTMAHRVGHALDRGNQVPSYKFYTRELTQHLYKMLDEIFGHQKEAFWAARTQRDTQLLLALATEIASMKSARERNLRNLTEFFHELTAQYIIEGKVTFRPIPKMLITSFTWGHPKVRTDAFVTKMT